MVLMFIDKFLILSSLTPWVIWSMLHLLPNNLLVVIVLALMVLLQTGWMHSKTSQFFNTDNKVTSNARADS